MNIREFLSKDRFAELLGIELLEVSNGCAKTKMEIKDEHLNAVKIAHGGIIFSLADFTLAAASNSHGNVALAINASINYVNPAAKEVLFAEAIEISRNNKLATYNINITNSRGEIIAVLQGMVYRKKENF